MVAGNATTESTPMMNLLSDPRDRYVRRAALTVLFLGVLTCGFVTVLHRLEPTADRLDLVFPPVLLVVITILWLVLFWFPGTLRVVLWVAFSFALLVGVLSIWAFCFMAFQSPEVQLVVVLPPVLPMLLPVWVFMLVFLNSPRAFWLGVLSWLLMAAPVLGYFWLHPAELWTPRGVDIVVILLPASTVLLALLPIQEGMNRRVSGLQRERSTWQALAQRDALTGLFNRRAGEGFLVELLSRPESVGGVVLFDVDHFKGINDTHGHTVGDQVLREIAQRCQGRLRRGDMLVRWGGEEFLAVIDGASEEVLARIAENLRQIIAGAPIGEVGTVTASFGVAGVRAGESVAGYLARVDGALYAAKGKGRNRVVRG